MKKIRNPKLVLQKDTLKHLGADELAGAVGGSVVPRPTTTVHSFVCPTRICPVPTTTISFTHTASLACGGGGGTGPIGY